MKPIRALIVVDVQNDFSDTGALRVPHGEEVVPVINKLMRSGYFDKIVLTQDWHPEEHCSFQKWPRHCVQGSHGAEFIRGLDERRANLILRKGMRQDVDSYSAFVENDGVTSTGLAGWLNWVDANDIYVCGLATDYCVLATAIDAIHTGRACAFISDACRGVNPTTTNEALAKMEAARVRCALSAMFL